MMNNRIPERIIKYLESDTCSPGLYLILILLLISNNNIFGQSSQGMPDVLFCQDDGGGVVYVSVPIRLLTFRTIRGVGRRWGEGVWKPGHYNGTGRRGLSALNIITHIVERFRNYGR